MDRWEAGSKGESVANQMNCETNDTKRYRRDALFHLVHAGRPLPLPL